MVSGGAQNPPGHIQTVRLPAATDSNDQRHFVQTRCPAARSNRWRKITVLSTAGPVQCWSDRCRVAAAGADAEPGVGAAEAGRRCRNAGTANGSCEEQCHPEDDVGGKGSL